MQKLPNPAWPSEIATIFIKEVSQTPFGCGHCCNAEFVSESRGEKTYFVVGTCRAGVDIDNGEPRQYCTAFMQPAGNLQDQKATGNASLKPMLKPLHQFSTRN
jgi:hypothetical protein